MMPPRRGPPRNMRGNKLTQHRKKKKKKKKKKSSGPYGFREEDFFMFFPCPGVGPVWTLGARLAGFVAGVIKRTTLHCYTQNMKALGLVVSEKRIF